MGLNNVKISDLEVYKLNEDCKLPFGSVYQKGRLIIKLKTDSLCDTLLCATPILKQKWYWSSMLENLKREAKVSKVDLLEETWIHPHLPKELKELVAIALIG